MAASVFLSYSRKDVGAADMLQRGLEAAGILVRRDVGDIGAGDVWRAKLVGLIRESDAVIVLLSSSSVASSVVKDEVALAIQDGKDVLPAYLEAFTQQPLPDELQLSLARIQRTDLYKDFARGLDDLVQAVLGRHERSRRPALRTSFQDLEELGSSGVEDLARDIEANVAAGRWSDAATLVSLGHCNLFLGRHPEARGWLRKAVDRDASSAPALFGYALSVIGGGRPQALTMGEAEQIARLLERAASLDRGSAHYEYLAAVVKADYYEGNGLVVPPPSVDALAASARAKARNASELGRMFHAVDVPRSVWERVAGA